MLVVLSEINCLERLNKLGVYPERFYTDFEEFKRASTMFKEATVLVIFGGCFRFSRNLTLQLVKGLMERSNREYDTGISHVYVFSDVVLSNLNRYYKYTDILDKVDIMKGWQVLKAGIFPWTKLQSGKRECKTFYSNYDMGDAEAAREAHKNRFLGEDEYIKLITIPTLKGVVSAS